jgi:hypothetical protein
MLAQCFTLYAQVLIVSFNVNLGVISGEEVALEPGVRYLLGASAVAFAATSAALLHAKKAIIYISVLVAYGYVMLSDQSTLVSHTSHLLGWVFGSLAYIAYSLKKRAA